MQKRLSAVLATAMLLFLAGCSETSSPTAIEGVPSETAVAQSFTDLLSMDAPEISAAANTVDKNKSSVAQINDGHLAVYTDRSTWEDALPPLFRLITEDFENSNTVSVLSCPGAIDQRTGGNGCYPTRREILKVVDVDNELAGNDPSGMVVLAPNFFGNPTSIAGPNFFSDNGVMSFDKQGLRAVGFELIDLFGGLTVDVYVYDADGLIGSFSAAPGFIGVRTQEDITMIKTVGTGGTGGELYDNLTFNYERFGQNR